MRDFHKFNPAIWKDQKFRKSLSDCQKLAYLFITTNHHQTMLGAYYFPDNYAANDLGWSVDEYREARQKLHDEGLIIYDDYTEEVFVANWFTINPPDNANYYLGMLKHLRKIQSKYLKDAIVGLLHKAIEEKGPPKWFGELESKGLVAELEDETFS